MPWTKGYIMASAALQKGPNDVYDASTISVTPLDWTEHEGLADALVMAGVVMTVESVRVGPFSSRAYRVLVLTPEVTGR